MSPRAGGMTFHMLHLQAQNQQRKQQLKSYKAEKDSIKQANKTNAVNSKSDTKLVKQYQTEFSLAI